MKDKCYRSPYRFVFIPFGVAACLALISLVVMLLWNHLLPGILGVSAITYWQAMGIFILCKILFGFGKGPGGPPWMRRRRMEERMKHLSPEEREKFREEMEHRMCGWKSRRRATVEQQPNTQGSATGTE